MSTVSDLGFAHVLKQTAEPAGRTIVLFHGTGGDEHHLLELGHALDPKANLLGVRGKSIEEGMNRYFRRYSEGVFDEEDLKLQAGQLATFFENVRHVYGLTGPLVGAGYSNGANMLSALMLLYPHIFDAAVLFRGMVPLIPETKPNLKGKHIFVASGNRDMMAPLDSAEQLVNMFRDYGAQVVHRVANGGHGMTWPEVQVAMVWLQGI